MKYILMTDPWDDCMYMYLLIYHTKSTIHVGEYTSPMNPMGGFITQKYFIITIADLHIIYHIYYCICLDICLYSVLTFI